MKKQALSCGGWGLNIIVVCLVGGLFLIKNTVFFCILHSQIFKEDLQQLK